MKATHLSFLAMAGLAASLSTAAAQSDTTEDRLRAVLRDTVTQLRAAQDSQTTLQAQLDQMRSQRDSLQQQLDRAKAQPQAAPAPAPTAAPATPAVDEDKYRAVIAALQSRNGQLQATLQKWQAAYQNAAGIAQSRDLDSRQTHATLATAQGTLSACETKNTRLIGVANDILHLYQSQSFRSLLVESYEPLLGLKKVQLENIVQDNEDRIRAQQYFQGEQPKPAAAPKAPAR